MKALKIFNLACLCIVLNNCNSGNCFWDEGTTTIRLERTDIDAARTSFFRWMWVFNSDWAFWFYYWDWAEIERRRRLCHVAGISIDMTPLSTGVILNRRAILTSYNFLDPFMNRQKELRIWALGRAGYYNTPYRYRVHRVHRLVPWSNNPEHCHGPRCKHQPRHDLSVIVTLDIMYVFPTWPNRFHYAHRALMPPSKYSRLEDWHAWMAGSGYEYIQHIEENYKIFYYDLPERDLVDCSRYLPKWWGKFICYKNAMAFPGVQNGGGYFNGVYVYGIGCFEIRYNEDRIFVFTDIRFYHAKVFFYADLIPGDYYEYAYPQWSVHLGWLYDTNYNVPYIPAYQKVHDLYPLG